MRRSQGLKDEMHLLASGYSQQGNPGEVKAISWRERVSLENPPSIEETNAS